MTKLFLDTNVLIHFLDESSDDHERTVNILEKIQQDDIQILLSHHIIEEYIHVQEKLYQLTREVDVYKKLSTNVHTLQKITNLFFLEPPKNINFVSNVIDIMKKYHLEANDAYILNLLIEKGFVALFTFDKKLKTAAKKLGIEVKLP